MEGKKGLEMPMSAFNVERMLFFFSERERASLSQSCLFYKYTNFLIKK